MNPTTARAALIADIAAICVESMQHDAEQNRNAEIIVRYSDCICYVVIRQNRQRPETRKRTKSGRPYAQMWRVVKWIDEEAKS